MANGYTRIQTSSTDLNRVQDSVQTAVGQIASGPFVGGNLLSSQSVGTGITQIPHKLTNTPTVLFLGPPNLNTSIWNPQASDSQFIYLQAGTACTVTVWVK